MNVLIIGAHPDDELLGVGGTMLKHIGKGDNVDVCIATAPPREKYSDDYIANKIKHQATVDEFVGVRKRFNLDMPTVSLNNLDHGHLNQMMTDVVAESKPDIIYTHFSGDINYDHTLVARASLVACRPPSRMKILHYETISETEWGERAFKPQVYVSIEKEIDRKIEAFQIYETEQKDYPHARSCDSLKALARKRGAEVCLSYCEAFELTRDIIV